MSFKEHKCQLQKWFLNVTKNSIMQRSLLRVKFLIGDTFLNSSLALAGGRLWLQLNCSSAIAVHTKARQMAENMQRLRLNNIIITK